MLLGTLLLSSLLPSQTAEDNQELPVSHEAQFSRLLVTSREGEKNGQSNSDLSSSSSMDPLIVPSPSMNILHR